MALRQQVSNFVYKNMFRKTTTFALAIAVGTLFADRATDVIAEGIWVRYNEGHLWKDVRKNLNPTS